MKGTNLNPALISRLKENIAGPGGLHHFDLSSANAGPKEMLAIADCIKYNYQSCEGMAPLISMDLSGNQVCGIDSIMQGTFDSDGLTELCNCLNNMSKVSRLRKLNLSRNFLDTKGFIAISNLLSNGPQSLVDINLRSCGGGNEAMDSLCEGIRNSKALIILDLRQNHFGKLGSEHIGDMLGSNSRLKQLNISECDVGHEGILSICRGLNTNDCLEVLSLADNNITDQGCEAIATVLRTNKRIRHLDLQENRIALEGVSLIAKSLTKNKTLVFLGLQWNDISNEGAARLAESLMYNTTLKSLHLVGNHVDADGISLMIESSLTCNEKPIDIDLGFSYQTAYK